MTDQFTLSKTKMIDLGQLHKDVLDATGKLEDSRQGMSIANTHHAQCVSRLNDIQKALHEAITAVRFTAPRELDWKREERERTMKGAK